MLMVFDYQSLRITEIFSPIDSKEQKLIMSLVVSLKLYMEFHKGQLDSFIFNICISDILFDMVQVMRR